MKKAANRQFRVGKIEVIKSFARRPKGLYRPDLVHKSARAYSRRRLKDELRRERGE